MTVEARINITLGAFFIRIADKDLCGTYQTTLYTIINLGILYLESVILYLSKFMSIYVMAFFG